MSQGRGPPGAGRGVPAPGRGAGQDGRAQHLALIENVVGGHGNNSHLHRFYHLHLREEGFRGLVKNRLMMAYAQNAKEAAAILTVLIDLLDGTNTMAMLRDRLNMDFKFTPDPRERPIPTTAEQFIASARARRESAQVVAFMSHHANPDGGNLHRVSLTTRLS